MSPKNKPLLKSIAWNGIELKIPVTWEIDSLDAGHMLIGEEGLPRMELKWTDASANQSFVKYMKKFITRSQKELGIKIIEQQTPASFSHPRTYFEFFFFNWQGQTASGYGALIFCTHCNRLTMIRFFPESTGLPGPLEQSIILSFDDHPGGDEMFWKIFGLDFPTPSHFRLAEYSFKPGVYSIFFKDGKTNLGIFSWGPAEFLLSQADLTEFALGRVPGIEGLARTGYCSHGSFLEWNYRSPRFKNAGLIPFLDRFSLFSIFRICHDPECNRIFGVKVDSPRRYEHDVIKRSLLGDV